MQFVPRRALVTTLVIVMLAALAVPAVAGGMRHGDKDGRSVRVATFNASLNRGAEGQLRADLSTPNNAQARQIAQIIQRVRPDVLLINEFDYDPAAVDLFRENYLEVAQNDARPIRYPYAFIDESNTGVLPDVPVDFDNNGSFALPGDGFGFGFFPGQFGMLSCHGSRFRPIGSGRSGRSYGGTCPTRCCPTTRPPPRPATTTPRTSSTCSG